MIATHSTALCSCAQYSVVSMLRMLKRGGLGGGGGVMHSCPE